MTPETILKNQIKSYLSLKKDCFTFPVLQGLGAFKGISDLICIKDGRFYAIEVKTPKGVQSPVQVNFESLVRDYGKGEYILARSLEDVVRVLYPQDLKKLK